MDNELIERLREVIEEDPRSMRAISRDAGLGPNYVQQALDGRKPTVDKLTKLLSALTDEQRFYVLTGYRMDQETKELLVILSGMDHSLRQEALRFFRALVQRNQHNNGHQP